MSFSKLKPSCDTYLPNKKIKNFYINVNFQGFQVFQKFPTCPAKKNRLYRIFRSERLSGLRAHVLLFLQFSPTTFRDFRSPCRLPLQSLHDMTWPECCHSSSHVTSLSTPFVSKLVRVCVCTICRDVKLRYVAGGHRVPGGRWPTKTPPGYRQFWASVSVCAWNTGIDVKLLTVVLPAFNLTFLLFGFEF